VDEAGLVAAEEVQRHPRATGGGLVTRAVDRDPQALDLRQRRPQSRDLVLRELDRDDAGELAAEPRHPALLPGTTVGGDRAGERVHESRAVVADGRENEC